MSKVVPKQGGAAHHPGMEGSSREGEYWLQLLAVGYSVVDTTIAINTEPTVAEMAVNPNTRSGVGCAGPVVHSLGQEPGAWFVQPLVSSIGAVSIQYITADNSAVYALARSMTAGDGSGLRVRVIAIA
jgi:hypothetical protein